jgi:hypothetical protein
MKKIFLIIVLFQCNTLLFGQNNRINTSNSIGWYSLFSTIKVAKKISIHAEYQWRRNNIITDWQQSLLRAGINYNVNPRILLRAGYAWAETFAYGEIPINSFGKQFTEHRIFEMAQLSQKEGILDITHRFMLEQRWIGKYTSANLTKEDLFPSTNRMRYMIKLQAPLNGKDIKDKTPYAAVYDEVMISFGKNVNANVFDQNRIGILLGYRHNQNIKVEAGFIHQILEFSRLINNKNIFQNNSGVVFNAYFNFDLMKKK